MTLGLSRPPESRAVETLRMRQWRWRTNRGLGLLRSARHGSIAGAVLGRIPNSACPMALGLAGVGGSGCVRATQPQGVTGGHDTCHRRSVDPSAEPMTAGTSSGTGHAER